MKRIIPLIMTVLVLGFLYYKIDFMSVVNSVKQTDILFFSLALLLFIPQFFFIAFRWKFLASVFQNLTFIESLKTTLGAQTLNLFLPSKAGDFAKIASIDRANASTSQRVGLIIIEKLLDVAALASVMVIGQMFYLFFMDELANSTFTKYSFLFVMLLGVFTLVVTVTLFFMRFVVIQPSLLPFAKISLLNKVYTKIINGLSAIYLMQSRRYYRLKLLGLTLCIWLLHLLQIYLFFWSLRQSLVIMPSTVQFAVFVPLAIFIGLIPITIAGFGTRDASLLLFFPGASPQGVLAVALFINLRYIIPALTGIPFVSRQLNDLVCKRNKNVSDSNT